MTSDAPQRTDLLTLATLALALLTPPLASAQPSDPLPPSDLRERAAAVRPVGMARGRATWDSLVVIRNSREGSSAQLITREESTSGAVDSLVLEVAHLATLYWLPVGPDEDFVLMRAGSPEIGASFRDTPAPGWRYEIGGAVTLPTRFDTTLDRPEARGSALPLDAALNVRSLGWNAHRLVDDTVSLIARAHVEWDPLPELVVALDVDVPVYISLEGEVAVYPQVALDLAGRYLDYQLVGLRAQLTSGPEAQGTNVLLEPFARFVAFHEAAAVFFRFALRFSVGPAFPGLGFEHHPGPGGLYTSGYVGGSVGIGALY